MTASPDSKPLEGCVAYREFEWDYRGDLCTDDPGSVFIEVQHPGNMVWELAGYLLADAPRGEIEDLVKGFADHELD